MFFKAGALYYAVFLLFIVSFIMGLFLLLFDFYGRESKRNIAIGFAQDNVSSALAIGTVGTGEKDRVVCFNDNMDSLVIHYSSWGLFEIIRISEVGNSIPMQNNFLVGDSWFGHEDAALVLPFEHKSLNICGTTNIVGGCSFVPNLLKKQMFEGISYAGGQNKVSFLSESNGLPEIDMTFNLHNKELLNKGERSPWEETIDKNRSIVNSFEDKTLVLSSLDFIEITDDICLKGNVVLYSEVGVYISRQASLEDVIIRAPIVEFESGFEGTLQVFASDKISIASDCRLNFPSNFCLINEGNEKSGEIFVGRRTVIDGAIVACAINGGEDENVIVVFEDVLMNGLVYANCKLQIKGFVNGSIYCDELVLETESGTYKNYLKDTRINFKELNRHFVFPLFEKERKRRKKVVDRLF